MGKNDMKKVIKPVKVISKDFMYQGDTVNLVRPKKIMKSESVEKPIVIKPIVKKIVTDKSKLTNSIKK